MKLGLIQTVLTKLRYSLGLKLLLTFSTLM